MNLKLATINTGRLCSPQKRKQLSDFCFAQKFDIVGLQEVAFSSCDFLEVNFSLLCNPGPKSCGTALLIKKNLNWSNPLFDPDKRLLRVCVCGITFVVVYAPSGQPGRVGRRKMFVETLPAYVSDIEGGLILLGDFNSVESSSERQENSSTPTDWALKEMKKGLELTDLWTKLRGGEDGHTFHHARGSSRIDRFFVNKIMEKRAKVLKLFPPRSLTILPWCVCYYSMRRSDRTAGEPDR
jgi:exonuclease III